MGESIPDAVIRNAAFEHVRGLRDARGELTSAQLAAGFQFQGQRVPLVNPQRGIFKPERMTNLLSIRTVFPAKGRKVWYDDQTEAHKQIFASDETVDYAFMGTDPNAADNRWLREAFENQTPIIYFLGTAPGRYQPMLPTFIVGWSASALKAKLAFGFADQPELVVPDSAIERRYALREVKQRLHQSTFREALIAAYGGRCALSGLPTPDLLDAAHIIADKDELMGQPVIPNGLALSKLHHAAFDTHLIGIDPDYRIHVSGRLLSLKDGPQLEALKQLDGGMIVHPARKRDYPDRERLALRFERFRAVA
jgi:putative restriction endonuclease